MVSPSTQYVAGGVPIGGEGVGEGVGTAKDGTPGDGVGEGVGDGEDPQDLVYEYAVTTDGQLS